MAPLLIAPAAFVALLGGAHLAPWAADAARAVNEADGVVVDVERLCNATDPLLDALADRPGSARWLDAIARAADRICAAAATGPGPTADIDLVIATLQAIRSAETRLHSAAGGARVLGPAAHAKTPR
jgi:hypothetical protein